MEIFNKEEYDLIIEAVNYYWHRNNALLKNNDLSDIERKKYKIIRDKSINILRKLGSF